MCVCSFKNTFHADVVIAGWESEAYSVQESALGMTICANQLADIQRDVELQVSSLPLSASSEYIIVHYTSLSTHCFS